MFPELAQGCRRGGVCTALAVHLFVCTCLMTLVARPAALAPIPLPPLMCKRGMPASAAVPPMGIGIRVCKRRAQVRRRYQQ